MERAVCAVSGNPDLIWVENSVYSGSSPQQVASSTAKHDYRLSKLLVTYAAFDVAISGSADPSVSISELNAQYTNDAGESYWTRAAMVAEPQSESASVLGEYEVVVPKNLKQVAVLYGKHPVRGVVGLSFDESQGLYPQAHVSGLEVGEVVIHRLNRDLVGFALCPQRVNLRERSVRIDIRVEEKLPLMGEQSALEAWERKNTGWRVERTWTGVREYQRKGHWLGFSASPSVDYWVTEARQVYVLVGERNPAIPLSKKTVADWRKAAARGPSDIVDRHVVPVLRLSLQHWDREAAKLVSGQEQVSLDDYHAFGGKNWVFWGKFDKEMRAFCERFPDDDACACLREGTPVHPKCFDQRCLSRGYRSRTYEQIGCQGINVSYIDQRIVVSSARGNVDMRNVSLVANVEKKESATQGSIWVVGVFLLVVLVACAVFAVGLVGRVRPSSLGVLEFDWQRGQTELARHSTEVRLG